jgi:hypothetical protein
MEQVQQLQNLPHAVKVVFNDMYQDSFLLDIPFDKNYEWLDIRHCLENNNLLRLYIRYVSRVPLDTLNILYGGPPYTELMVPSHYESMEVFSSIRVTVFKETSEGVWREVEEGITINV